MRRLLFAAVLATTPFLYSACASANGLMQTLGRTMDSVGRLAGGGG
jgi:hypothetical protein